MNVLPVELPDYVKTDIAPRVSAALAEDLGSGDITALLIPEEKITSATLVCRDEAVVCGIAWVEEVFSQLPGELEIRWHVYDGDRVAPGTRLCEMQGNSRKILTGERTALNFLQTLSATATAARTYADAASGRNITVMDTRKTIPGLRTAQKYAVLCGGCSNHRLGLFDQFLIKENHIAACGDIARAVKRARELAPEKTLVLEVESLAELAEGIEARPDRIMLDDFSHEAREKAFSMVPEDVDIEISGSQDIESISQSKFPRPVCISIGALTKHVQAIDLSLRIE